MLVARKSDLELQLQFINQARTTIANLVGNFALGMANNIGQITSPTMGANPQQQAQQDAINQQAQAQDQQNQLRMVALQQVDKVLEMNAQRINTQHQAVSTEISAVQKVISKNIQMSFKLMG